MKSQDAFFNDVEKSARMFRALNHKLRRRIIEFLQSDGRKTVTEIQVMLRVEQSVTSQHLAILRKAKLLTSVREGKFIYYTVNTDNLKLVADGMAAFEALHTAKLAA